MSSVAPAVEPVAPARTSGLSAIFEHTLGELGGIAPNEALHVGDLEELDVEGARRAGLHSARYVPDTDVQIETDADFVVTDWREFADQVADYLKELQRREPG